MKGKTLLLIICGILIAGVGTGFFLWNKRPETVDDKKGIQLTATVLADSFEKNEQQANTAYLNKVLEVTGKISELSSNQDGNTVLLLESSDPLSGVQCTLRDKGQQFETGKTVTVKGFCNGYTMVVLLSDCIITGQ